MGEAALVTRARFQRTGGCNFYYADGTTSTSMSHRRKSDDYTIAPGTHGPNSDWRSRIGSVLTPPQYRRSRINSEIERAFYKTGKLDVRVFLNACERNDVALNFAGTAVDLGCGIGRLGVHLSEKFRRYVGVDVSGPHLEIAKARMMELGRDNVELVLLPEFLAGNKSFDLLVSLIALQHNPPPLIVELLHKILPRLNRGGIAFFQVPSVLFNYNFRLPEYLKTLNNPAIWKCIACPRGKYLRILAAHNCQPVEVLFDGKAGDLGLSYTFIARKT